MTLYQRALAKYCLFGCSEEMAHEIGMLRHSGALYHKYNFTNTATFVASACTPGMYDRDICVGMLYMQTGTHRHYLMCLSGIHLDMELPMTELGKVSLYQAALMGGNPTTIKKVNDMGLVGSRAVCYATSAQTSGYAACAMGTFAQTSGYAFSMGTS